MILTPHYYNEFDPYAAQWLRNAIAAKLIPVGEVDERSIVDVKPDDLIGFRQCHFFAGIGGWALAARLAGFPEDRELWTGSAPCQPFSVAGQGKAQADDRHLWPHFFRLIRARRPAALMGEQVAAAVGKDWLDGVCADLEGIGYACGAAVVPACAVDAPHRRDRLWFVGHRNGAVDHGDDARLEGLAGHGGAAAGRQEPDRPVAAAGGGSGMADAAHGDDGLRIAGAGAGRESEPGSGGIARAVADTVHQRWETGERPHDAAGLQRHGVDVAGARGSAWSGAGWIIGHDGKARRVGSEICQLVDGLPAWLAGLCPDVYAEAAEKVRLYGAQTYAGPDQALREVFLAVHAQPAADWSMGVSPGIRAQEILLAFVRELAGRCGLGGGAQSIEEAAVAELRSLRELAVSSCAPYRREPAEQQPGEHSDALQALSWFLASHAAAAWAAYGQANARPMALLAHGVPARVGKLRALGNAIVPQVAAEVIGAYMDCYP